jgi:alpha-tubulin suppressor-like RCC1 family protein
MYQGVNNVGQIGDGTIVNRLNPVQVIQSGVLSGLLVTAISAGADQSLALTSSGQIIAWGYNNYGQIGDGTTSTTRYSPVLVTMSGALLGKHIISIASGQTFSIALSDAGLIFTWVNNMFSF